MPKIAVITEVYNGLPTLAQTVQSVLAQTAGDFVYFLGDDGSTDGTAELVQKLAAQDGRIQATCFAQNNMRANFNTLLAQAYASGAEYLAILDGDDWLEDSFFEYMLQFCAASDADIAMARFAPHRADGSPLAEPLMGFGKDVLYTLPQFCEDYPACSMFPTAYQWWGKLFRISMLKKAQLWAEESWDIGFSAASYHFCERIAFCDEVFLHYRCREDSDSHRRLAYYDDAKEVRVQTELHTLRRGLLAAQHCQNPLSWQMACCHDLREAYVRLMRLMDADLSGAAIALGIESILGLPFLHVDYVSLVAALESSATPFGASPARAAAFMEEQRVMLTQALQHCEQYGMPQSALWAKWANALRL